MSPIASARDLAFVVLDEHRRTGGFVTRLLDLQLSASTLPPVERRLAMELALGVVRRQGTLDALLAPHVRRPRHAVEGPLWTVLQLGAYQLALLETIPAHAAVHETVELAKRHGRPRWAQFVNGVLRSVSRNLTSDNADGPAADALPLTAGRYRRLAETVFPDPERNPVGYLSTAFSQPRWLIERWWQRFSFEDIVALGFWYDTPPPLWLRVNRLRTSRDEFLAALANAGLTAESGELPEAVRVLNAARVEDLPGFAEGWFTVQDLTAMRAAEWLDPQPGESVLDLCAAPGTKTTHLAERMQCTGTLIATDVQPERLQRIFSNCRRLGLTIIEPRLIHADDKDVPEGPFDAVLVDAPCSNTGVLGRRPDARWRITPDDLRELPELQQRLLATACRKVRPGGRVLYSTCSIEPEENRDVVDAVLSRQPQFTLVRDAVHYPGRPADGGYLALLRHMEDLA